MEALEAAANMLDHAQSFVDRTCPGCGPGELCMPGHRGLGTFDACRILIAAEDFVGAEIRFRRELENVRKAAAELGV